MAIGTWRQAILFGAVLLAAGPALAQQPTRVRGTIEKVDGNTITVKARDGATLTVAVPDNVAVIQTEKRTLADIKPGAFIGTGALPGDDGVWRAAEVHIFPESMRGSGEGHRAWEAAGSSMTNATVDETVTGVSGNTFTLRFPGGEVKVVVTPETPIVAFAAADRGAIKPGKAIFVPSATKAEDGSLRAARIMIEGSAPPPM